MDVIFKQILKNMVFTVMCAAIVVFGVGLIDMNIMLGILIIFMGIALWLYLASFCFGYCIIENSDG